MSQKSRLFPQRVLIYLLEGIYRHNTELHVAVRRDQHAIAQLVCR